MHGILSRYAGTTSTDGPFILVVGREPNTEAKIENKLDNYNFRTSPRCAFWNCSHALIGESVGKSARELKDELTRRERSPVLYADALPIGIPNGVQNKWPFREQVSEIQKLEHAASILAHSDFIDRVGLVLMSGIENSLFTPSRQALIDGMPADAIVVENLRQFYGTNSPANRLLLPPQAKKRCGEIVNDFLERTAPLDLKNSA